MARVVHAETVECAGVDGLTADPSAALGRCPACGCQLTTKPAKGEAAKAEPQSRKGST